jgi:hypothetical protein
MMMMNMMQGGNPMMMNQQYGQFQTAMPNSMGGGFGFDNNSMGMMGMMGQ